MPLSWKSHRQAGHLMTNQTAGPQLTHMNKSLRTGFRSTTSALPQLQRLRQTTSRGGLKGLLEILRNPAFKVSDLAAQTMQGLMGHVERRLPFAKTTLVELTTVQQIVRKRTQTALVNGRRFWTLGGA